MTPVLQALGFGPWFQHRVDADLVALHELARIVSVQKDSYLLSKGSRSVFAELTGRLMYNAASALDLPTVGDWVYADFFDADAQAIIHALLPRKTLLKRKAAGKSSDVQLIAANIDTAFILQAAGHDFNPRRLERYLVMVHDSAIEPIILLSKSDLQSPQELQRIIASTHEIAAGASVIAFSNQDGTGI
jgi:ribosome biogenesis GTPase